MTQNRTERLVFVKLGGSVITDKNQPETERPEMIARLADEVARALAQRSDLHLVLGHGSGSFGHTVAQYHGTRQGVRTPAQWRGFAEVATIAATLNRIVTEHFLEAGVPAWSLQPSASAWCRAGKLVSLATGPIAFALDQGMVPMVYGDVALDEVQGGTIISTEQIFAFLARELRPDRLVLVGAVDGVHDGDPLRNASAKPIPEITEANWEAVQATLGGSYATDVTGGMRTKVEATVELVRDLPGLTGHIISGERPGTLERLLLDPTTATGGTLVHWQGTVPTGT